MPVLITAYSVYVERVHLESRGEFRNRMHEDELETTPGRVLGAETDQLLPHNFPDLLAVVTQHPLYPLSLSNHAALFLLFTSLTCTLPCSVLKG